MKQHEHESTAGTLYGNNDSTAVQRKAEESSRLERQLAQYGQINTQLEQTIHALALITEKLDGPFEKEEVCDSEEDSSLYDDSSRLAILTIRLNATAELTSKLIRITETLRVALG